MLPSNVDNHPSQSSTVWSCQLGEAGNTSAITTTSSSATTITGSARADSCNLSSTLETDAANTLATLFREASSNSGSDGGGSGGSGGSGVRGSIRSNGSGSSRGGAAVADRFHHYNNVPAPYPASPSSSGISFVKGERAGGLRFNLDNLNSNPDYHHSCLISAATKPYVEVPLPPAPVTTPPKPIMPASIRSASSSAPVSPSPSSPHYIHSQHDQSALQSPSPSPTAHRSSSSASSVIQVHHHSTSVSRTRSRQADVSDSDQTESDRVPTDSEETEEDEFPHISSRLESVVTLAATSVGVSGQRGVAKAIKKGRKPATQRRVQREDSVSIIGTPSESVGGTTKKKSTVTKSGRKKGIAVSARKKRQKVETEGVGEVPYQTMGDDYEIEDSHPPISPSSSSAEKPLGPTTNDSSHLAPNGPTPNGTMPHNISGSPSSFPPGPYDPSLALYCFCRRPDSGKLMIACDGCDDWFHGECIPIPQSDEDLIESYFCPTCTSLERGVTNWKRKCRLPECRKPAAVGFAGGGKPNGNTSNSRDPPSKYCSQDHGIAFFEQHILRSRIGKALLAAVVVEAEGVGELHALGDRIPTPPLENREVGLEIATGEEAEELSRRLELARQYPETQQLLKKMYEQMAYLERRVKPLLTLRARYIEHCWDRRARVIDRFKEEAVRSGETGGVGGELDDSIGGATKSKTAKGGKKSGGRGSGKGGGSARWDICGYDARLSWGDEEFLQWVSRWANVQQEGRGGTPSLKSSEEGGGEGEKEAVIDVNTDQVDFAKIDEMDPLLVEGLGGIITSGNCGGNNTAMASISEPIYHHPPLCTRKKCNKHQQWQKVRFEEVQLEERLWDEKMTKLREEEGRVWEALKRKVWRDREREKRKAKWGNDKGEEAEGWVVEEANEEVLGL